MTRQFHDKQQSFIVTDKHTEFYWSHVQYKITGKIK